MAFARQMAESAAVATAGAAAGKSEEERWRDETLKALQDVAAGDKFMAKIREVLLEVGSQLIKGLLTPTWQAARRHAGPPGRQVRWLVITGRLLSSVLCPLSSVLCPTVARVQR